MTTPPRSLRSDFDALPTWARVLVVLFGASLAGSLAFLVVWVIGVVLMLLPWAFLLGWGLLRQL